MSKTKKTREKARQFKGLGNSGLKKYFFILAKYSKYFLHAFIYLGAYSEEDSSIISFVK